MLRELGGNPAALLALITKTGGVQQAKRAIKQDLKDRQAAALNGAMNSRPQASGRR